MRKVPLAPGVLSSALGFGCAPILGSVGAREASQAIGCALDVGVNHFDLARCYGYGDAEKFVGRELRARRGEVVIASKFGLEATELARLMRPVKPLVRLLREALAQNGPQGGKPSDQGNGRLLRKVPVSAEAMSASLEKSLRALGTDYLDILFLHEPDWELLPVEEIAEAAEELKRQGKIRAFGAAFYRGSMSLGELPPGVFDILQFEVPKEGLNGDALRDRTNVFFSPFRTGGNEADSGSVLRNLFRDFPNSVVLCSMFKPDHIRSNAASVI